MSQPPIYILDDESQVLSLLSDIAQCVSFETKCYLRAKDLFAEIEVFDKNSVLVLDLSMPEMDGIEVMRYLASMTVKPSLILMSGQDVGVLHAAEKLCAAHHLEHLASLKKPIQITEFQELLQRHVARVSYRCATTLKEVNAEFEPYELLFAIKNNQLELFYQPKVNLKTRGIVGLEALVRWRHPTKGVILPDKFISIAVYHGWIGLLTNWVIEKAVQQEEIWHRLDLHFPVAVNICADSFTGLSLPEQLMETLNAKMLQPTMLTLEVTETALMGELSTSLDILTRLRLKGVGLSIDDFGTGYSSLSQLHRLPFTELKIDCSFVTAMLADAEAKAIVRTCIILGHELNMLVVAEGGESLEHLDLLQEMGCDIVQGYFLCRPLPVEEITSYLKTQNTAVLEVCSEN